MAKNFRFSQIRYLSYHYFFQQCFDCGSFQKPFLSLRFTSLFLIRIIPLLYSRRTPIPTYDMAAIMSDILSCQRRWVYIEVILSYMKHELKAKSSPGWMRERYFCKVSVEKTNTDSIFHRSTVRTEVTHLQKVNSAFWRQEKAINNEHNSL